MITRRYLPIQTLFTGEHMRLMVYSRALLAAALLALALALAPWPAQAGVNIEHWTTGNGVRVYFTPAPELPIVDVRMVMDAGSARDGEQPGVAGMTDPAERRQRRTG